MTNNLRLDFKKLPLVEAAVRASFNAPKPLTYSLLNSIANKLRPSFPNWEEPKQLEVPPGIGAVPIEISPGHLPGAVYSGNPSGLAIAVQPQVIITRWVRPPGLEQPEYPRYPALSDSHWLTVEEFRKFCGNEFPGISVVNMSYVNFIPSTEAAGFLRTYFSDRVQLGAMDHAEQIRKLEAAWCDGDDLDLRFAIEQAAAKMPSGVTPGYRLTTAAGLRLGESNDAKQGLDRVHTALQDFFLKLISEDAKTEWKLQTS